VHSIFRAVIVDVTPQLIRRGTFLRVGPLFDVHCLCLPTGVPAYADNLCEVGTPIAPGKNGPVDATTLHKRGSLRAPMGGIPVELGFSSCFGCFSKRQEVAVFRLQASPSNRSVTVQTEFGDPDCPRFVERDRVIQVLRLDNTDGKRTGCSRSGCSPSSRLVLGVLCWPCLTAAACLLHGALRACVQACVRLLPWMELR
jgi:hypothetical protein